MLVELSIRNFAIISSLTVPFKEGLHVMTGETGAGKSMIMDAVSMLIGGRASADYVRYGTKKAEIEGLFELPSDHPVFPLLQELGIEGEEQMLILRRDISHQGKSVCRVNGKLTTLAVLREIGQTLVDIHGQHEHQHLLHEENHLHILDEYGRDEIAPHKKEYDTLYQQYRAVTEQVKHLNENEQQLAQRLDLLRFQMDEIAAAGLEPGEDERLEKEKRKHVHAQKIFKGVSESYHALQNDGGIIDSLGLVLHHLQELSHLDEDLLETSKLAENAFYQLEETLHQLGRYQDDIDFQPEELNQIESRLMLIDQLKKKYGQDVQQILEYAAEIEDELDSIEHKEQRIEELEQKQKQILLDLTLEAEQLSNVRTKVAKYLVQEVKKELQGLHMDQTDIHIEVVPSTHGHPIEHHDVKKQIRKDGWDDVQILIAPNPGEPLKPLSKIASGGELSRLMLALKSVFSKNERITTLIFDEVDTGVSGRVAQAMAEKLYTISRNQQVICISHHSQVAAMADQPFRIVKQTTDEITETNVVPLTDPEQKDELAKMMSGAEVTEATLKHAEELLISAAEIKNSINQKRSI